MPVQLSSTLTAPQLAELTRDYAREFSAGEYFYVSYDEDERWHRRIYRDGRMDLWVIGWLPDQGTELHDHGGSAGSFTVVSGTLTETVVTGGRLHDRVHRAGATAGFGARHVHDVRNLSSAPAVSVHAYSPPLTTMTYYGLDCGRLRVTASIATDEPEPDARLRDAS